MKRSIILPILTVIALMSNVTANSTGTESNGIKKINPDIDTPFDNGNGDVLMPTLSELLGEAPEYDPLADLQEKMVEYAKNYLGCRYVHGGKGPKVFDCSGFTSYVYRNFGYSISPASKAQGAQGQRVSLKDAQVGDLMFFSGRAGGKSVGHVGMVVEVNEETGSLKFIHASTKKGVTIQNFPDGKYYSQHFLHVQRIIDQDKLMADND
ncbi:MAG: C40 family peptidase [Muribaculaceae bacterium]|nr:C40 family peptidase [Muribaculaceae bacterium]